MSPRLIRPTVVRRKTMCVPGSVLLKMALGEAPDHVATIGDIRRRRQSASASLDGGPVDRISRALGGRVRYSRVHGAAASLQRPGTAHQGFDDAEQVLGLARTFRVDVRSEAPIP